MKEVAAVFKQYTAVERIATVWRRVQELQGHLRTILDEEFDALLVLVLSLFATVLTQGSLASCMTHRRRWISGP